jgi:hypothetical protein
MRPIKGPGGYPDLVAVMPTKTARMTLTPFQQVVLHSVLSAVIDKPGLFPFLGDAISEVEELEGQLSDRLTFRSVGRA